MILLIAGDLELAKATHIVGGELTYRCLGNNKFEFTLTVYRDCYTGIPWFDDPASIGVYDADWNLVKDVRVNWNDQSNDTLPINLDNPCLVVPPDVCAHGTKYVTEIDLPFKTGGYTVVYQRCCRNELIRNIIGPLRTGISIISVITEEALNACNNSAVFNKWPPVAICIHEPINFDHSATDPDGDSLVYRLCTPLQGADSIAPIPQPPLRGPYLEVVWNDPPYNLSNVLSGDPLHIDPATGFLTGIPNTLGNFVVGVCVDEYRNDTLLSTTRRDFQYNVADCGVPTASFFVPLKVCENQPVQFVNQSIALTYKWFFDWKNSPDLNSTEHSPVYSYPDTGTYTVALITAPGEPCADTMFQEIHIGSNQINAAMTVEMPSCDNDGLIVKAMSTSMDSLYGINSYQWRLTGPGSFSATSTDSNHIFQVTKPGTYKLRLIVLSEGGCRDTADYQFNAPIPRTDSLLSNLTICVGDTIRLNSGGIPYMYNWSPPQTLSDTTAPDPLAFPSVTTDYLVTVTNLNCTYEGMVTVTVIDTSDLSVSADPTTIYIGETSQLNALFPANNLVTWTPPATLTNPNIPNPVASPGQTTTYTASLNLNSGCSVDRSVTVVVLAPFCGEPYVFFPTGFSPNGDGENDVLQLESRFVEEVYWAIYNRWGQKIFETNDVNTFWDGTYKGEPQPAETYGYLLRVRCPGSAEMIKKGNVTLLR